MDTGVTRRALLGSVGTAAVAAARGSVPTARAQTGGEWPTFAFDAANSGYAPDAQGPTEDVGGNWRVDLGPGVASSPALVNGTVYVGSDDTHLYALDATDGSEQWRFETGDRVTSSPTVVDGTVYVGSNDGSVYAVDAAQGTEEWSVETDGQIAASPTVVDGTLYIGSRDDSVYALDAADGTEKWTYETSNDVSATPAVADGTVYVGSEDRRLYALDAADGSEQWRFETPAQITAAPVVSDDGGTVYVGDLAGNLFAIDTESAEADWGVNTGGAIVASPAVDLETVYVGSRSGTLYAFSVAGGDERWSFETGMQIVGSPSVAGSVVYVGSQSQAVFGLLRTDGSRLWQFDTEGFVTTSPAIVDGTVFVGAGDGAFYALQEGSRLPTTETPTPAGGSDGGSSLLSLLVLPAAIVTFVAFLVGTGYVAKRAGLFEPIEQAAPDPPDSGVGDGESDRSGAGGSGGSEGPAVGGELFPVWDVVIDDVIGRAAESRRTATEDILITKHVDPDTLAQPMVAYEIESLWDEPVTVRLSEPLAGSGIPDEAIGRLGKGWQVLDGRILYEVELEPEGTARTVVARSDRSPDEIETLLAKPRVTVEQ